MSQTQSTHASAVLVPVTALVVVEHDREKHVPGVQSGPEAETFAVPEHVAESLVKAGAVKRADVIDTADLLGGVGADSTNSNVASQPLVTFADVGDLVDADALRTQLAEAASENQRLTQQLSEAAAARDSLAEQLELANTKLHETQALLALAQSAGAAGVGAAGDPAAADGAGGDAGPAGGVGGDASPTGGVGGDAAPAGGVGGDPAAAGDQVDAKTTTTRTTSRKAT